MDYLKFLMGFIQISMSIFMLGFWGCMFFVMILIVKWKRLDEENNTEDYKGEINVKK